MKINRRKLLDAVKNCAKAALKVTTMEVFQSTSIESDGKHLVFSAINPELTVKQYVSIDEPAGDEEFKSMVFDTATLLAAINKLTTEPLILMFGNNQLVIKAGRTKVKINALSDVIFDSDSSDAVVSQVSYDMYRDIMDVYHATSSGKNDPRMNSFYLEFSANDGYSITALDGFRISRRTNNFDASKIAGSFIVPSKAFIDAAEMVSNKGNDNVTIKVTGSDKKIELSDCDGNLVTTVAIVAGQYFNINKIVSGGSTSDGVKVSKRELLDALSACTIFSDIVRMEFTVDSITVASVDATKGETTADVEIRTGSLTPFTTGFNATYLKDALNAIPSEDVTLIVESKIAPVYITSDNLDQVLECIIPVRLDDC